MSRTRTTGSATLLAVAGLLGTACGGGDGAPSASAQDAPAAPSADAQLFTDSFADDSNGWALPQNADGRTDVEDGDFVWESRSPSMRPHLLPQPFAEAFDRGELRMRDVVVTATATVLRGEPVVGVFCREVRDTDADFQWYEFVARDGYAAIRRADSAGDLDVLAKTDDVQVGTGEEIELTATCVDDAQGGAGLWFAVDAEQVLYVRDENALGNGAPGLQAYDAPVEATDDRFLVRWHDFTVTSPAS